MRLKASPALKGLMIRYHHTSYGYFGASTRRWADGVNVGPAVVQHKNTIGAALFGLFHMSHFAWYKCRHNVWSFIILIVSLPWYNISIIKSSFTLLATTFGDIDFLKLYLHFPALFSHFCCTLFNLNCNIGYRCVFYIYPAIKSTIILDHIMCRPYV